MESKTEYIEHVTLDRIRQYLDNQLDSKARFAFERHLLDCALCNEALEGYEDNHHREEDILELKELLDKRIQKNDKESVFWRYRYYGISASLVLFMVSIFLVIDTNPVSENEELALQSEPSVSEPEELGADTAFNNQSVEPAEKNRLESIVKNESITRQLVTAEPLTEKGLGESAASSIGGDSTDPTIGLLDEADEKGVGSLALKKIDELIADADVVTEDEEILREQRPTSSSPVTLQATQEASQTLQEKLGSEAFKSARNETLRARSATIELNNKPVPQIGKAEFDIYLQRNLQYPSDASNNSIEGEVEVAFKVEVDGSVGDIEVIRSLGFGCDEEVIRLINEGPDWVPARENGIPVERKAQVIVFFKLKRTSE